MKISNIRLIEDSGCIEIDALSSGALRVTSIIYQAALKEVTKIFYLRRGDLQEDSKNLKVYEIAQALFNRHSDVHDVRTQIEAVVESGDNWLDQLLLQIFSSSHSKV